LSHDRRENNEQNDDNEKLRKEIAGQTHDYSNSWSFEFELGVSWADMKINSHIFLSKFIQNEFEIKNTSRIKRNKQKRT
jgi:hypothetical protein